MRRRGQPIATSSPTTSTTEDTPLVSDVLRSTSDIPQVGGDWDRIITNIFTIDERAAFERLTRELSFGEGAHRREYSEIFDALDMATTRTDEASRLYVNAKAALAVFLADVAHHEADMREQARGSLEHEKADRQRAAKEEKLGGSGGKPITDGDVVARMSKMFPDEYRRIEGTRTRAEEAVGHMKRLLERWEERTRALDAMLRSSRKL